MRSFLFAAASSPAGRVWQQQHRRRRRADCRADSAASTSCRCSFSARRCRSTSSGGAPWRHPSWTALSNSISDPTAFCATCCFCLQRRCVVARHVRFLAPAVLASPASSCDAVGRWLPLCLPPPLSAWDGQRPHSPPPKTSAAAAALQRGGAERCYNNSCRCCR